MYFRAIQQCSSSTVTHSLTVLACLCLYLCGFVSYLWIEPHRTADSTKMFLIIVYLHSAWGVLLLVLLRYYHTPIVQSPQWFALVFICSRFMVLPMQPWLSDDVWRYFWDGVLFAKGVNPYHYTPNATELALFRSTHSELYALLDYRNYSTIYPPVAQYVFALSIKIGEVWGTSIQEKLLAWKSILIVSEGIGLWYTWKAQSALKQDLIWLWVYCCLPMTAVEVSGQAHVDGLLLAPLGWLIWLTVRGKYRFTVVPIALLGAIKIVPIVCALPLGVLSGNESMSTRFCQTRFYVVLAALTFILWLPLFSNYEIWRIYWHHASLMTSAFQFNGGVYYALCYVCEAMQIKNFWLFTPMLLSIIRFCAVLVVGVIGVYILKNRYHAVVHILSVFSIALLVSAKVHTWYFLPLLLFNGVVGWKWLYLLALGSMLSYSYYACYPNQEQYGVELAVWGIAFCVGISEMWYYRHALQQNAR